LEKGIPLTTPRALPHPGSRAVVAGGTNVKSHIVKSKIKDQKLKYKAF
jgi:hypothetical protein